MAHAVLLLQDGRLERIEIESCQLIISCACYIFINPLKVAAAALNPEPNTNRSVYQQLKNVAILSAVPGFNSTILPAYQLDMDHGKFGAYIGSSLKVTIFQKPHEATCFRIIRILNENPRKRT